MARDSVDKQIEVRSNYRIHSGDKSLLDSLNNEHLLLSDGKSSELGQGSSK